MADNTTETAKWSVSERIDLASALARIEASLKRQDEALDDLVEHSKFSRARLEKLHDRIQATRNRVLLHEKVVASLITAGGILAGAIRFLFAK